MTRKILLTVAVALYVLVALAGLLALANLGPVFAVIALAGMAANGLMAGDWMGMIWRLEGQYDDGLDY